MEAEFRADGVCTPSNCSLVRIKARKLTRRPEFRECESEDVEQMLWLALHQQAAKFDPGRAKFSTFCSRGLDWAAAMLIRSRKRAFRRCGRPVQSLETLRTGVADPVFGSDAASRADGDRRLGRSEPDDQERADLRDLIDAVIRTLPPHLVDLCGGLGERTITEVASDLGLSRQQVYRMRDQIRAKFEDAGIKESEILGHLGRGRHK